jgi:ribosomal silencing factor RsfS
MATAQTKRGLWILVAFGAIVVLIMVILAVLSHGACRC